MLDFHMENWHVLKKVARQMGGGMMNLARKRYEHLVTDESYMGNMKRWKAQCTKGHRWNLLKRAERSIVKKANETYN